MGKYRSVTSSTHLCVCTVMLLCDLTYIFFGENSGEAEVTGHLGFEKTVFPQVSIQAISGGRDLEEEN